MVYIDSHINDHFFYKKKLAYSQWIIWKFIIKPISRGVFPVFVSQRIQHNLHYPDCRPSLLTKHLVCMNLWIHYMFIARALHVADIMVCIEIITLTLFRSQFKKKKPENSITLIDNLPFFAAITVKIHSFYRIFCLISWKLICSTVIYSPYKSIFTISSI